MKGAIASRTEARVADLSHEVAPFDIFGAAWFLRSVVAYWPEGTVFVAVIDPGVGTARKIIAAQRDGRTFLAPDNGVLSLVIEPPAISVENESFFLPQGSATFHGRDRFAPVAAAIANGTALDAFGPPVDDIVRVAYTPPEYGSEEATGTLVAIDHYGNLITDIEVAKIPFATFVFRAGWHVVDRRELAYGAAERGAMFVIVGSSGCLEVSVANGSAADVLQLRRGDRVTVTPK